MELYKKSDIELVNNNLDKIIESIEEIKKELYPNEEKEATTTDTEKVVEKKEPKPEDVAEIAKITLEFVAKKQRKVYGGFAQNAVVRHKNPEDAFYTDDVAPDIDVYSPEPIQDLVELCNLLYEKGYTDVVAKEAMHPETYKIFTRDYNAIDLSYVPKNVYNSIPYVEIDKIRYVHPSFAMIDLYRMMSEPLFSSWRWEKTFNRLYLLQKHYPFKKLDHKVNNAYKHKKDVKLGLQTVLDFVKDNPSVYVFGDFAYNQLVKEAKVSGIDEIDIGIYRIVSNNYVDDVYNLIDRLKALNRANVETVEYYPFWSFTDYSVEIVYDGEVIARIYKDLKRCSPIKKVTVDGGVVQIGSFDYILLMEMVMSFRQKTERDNYKKTYHDTLISNIVRMRNDFFEKKNKNLLDNTLFQSFLPICIGEGLDPRVEAKKHREKRKASKSGIFSYKPVRELTYKWVFANTSGNKINNPKNLKLKRKKTL